VVNRTCCCDARRLRRLLDDALEQAQQDEVLAHLDSCAACQRGLESLAADETWWEQLRGVGTASDAVPASLAALVARGEAPTGPAPDAIDGRACLGFLDPTDEPGCLGRLGPYAVTAVLGLGGMGIVLAAYDAVLDRPVAVKVLSPHMAGAAAARDRFAREGRAAAAVVHPNVVPVHGVDSWKGLPYLVMAHVAGRSLQERISAEGPLGVEEVLRVGAEAAAGLAAAHARGLVHRDVKPANILLEAGTGRVLLTDFGLARAADGAGLTQSGVIPGTPAYMAPEQARGEPADQRSDLFSLGGTLYAACSGRPPFGCDAPLAVLRRVCEGRPAPLRSLAPDVPGWLADVIERLLASRPEGRFGSAAEVARLLAGCLEHVRRPGSVPLPPGVRGGRRRLARWAAVAALGALLLTGLCAGPADPPRPASPPDRPPLPAGAAAAQGPEGSRDESIDGLRLRLKALEDDLRRGDGGPAPDPAGERLRELRRRLDALERDRGATAP
jgi:serine/threonine-protein kinase